MVQRSFLPFLFALGSVGPVWGQKAAPTRIGLALGDYQMAAGHGFLKPGTVSAASLSKNFCLQPTDPGYALRRFQLSCKKKDQPDILGPFIVNAAALPCTLRGRPSSGASTDPKLSFLAGLAPGDVLFLEEIEASNPQGATIRVAPLALNVR